MLSLDLFHSEAAGVRDEVGELTKTPSAEPFLSVDISHIPIGVEFEIHVWQDVVSFGLLSKNIHSAIPRTRAGMAWQGEGAQVSRYSHI